MGRLGHKKTLLSGWTATQEADLQGGEIHLRPVPRHRTLPGAEHNIYLESTVTAFQILRSFRSGSALPKLQRITLVNPSMCLEFGKVPVNSTPADKGPCSIKIVNWTLSPHEF
jgi:hypothetical protein